MKLLWHLGLGDAIICAPLAVKLAKEFNGLTVPCYSHNEESVKSFFVNHPEIQIGDKPDDHVISLGYYASKEIQEPFNTWFYNQLGLNYDETVQRYCPLQKAAESVPQIDVVGKYILVHDDAHRGFNINPLNTDLRIGRVEPHGSILAYATLIKYAEEIHCIDSSFIHLADRLESSGQLFYHKYARPNSQKIHFLKPWTVYESN